MVNMTPHDTLNVPVLPRNVHQFTELDWVGFADAVRWPNKNSDLPYGDEPLVSHGQNRDGTRNLIVACSEVVSAFIDGDEQSDNYGGYVLPVSFPTQTAAAIFLAGMPHELTPEYLKEIGFES